MDRIRLYHSTKVFEHLRGHDLSPVYKSRTESVHLMITAKEYKRKWSSKQLKIIEHKYYYDPHTDIFVEQPLFRSSISYNRVMPRAYNGTEIMCTTIEDD